MPHLVSWSRHVGKALLSLQVYSPSRPPPATGNLLGELWQTGKTVTQGELEVVSPGYVFNTIAGIKPGEGSVWNAHVFLVT